MKITETERLLIEEASPTDASFFYKLLNSAGWLTYVGDRNIKSEQDAETYIMEKIIKSYAANGYGLYVMKLKERSEPIGICGFVKRDYLPSADLGFAILPEYERKGYTYEAGKSLLAFGFTAFLFQDIFAVTSQANEKSQNLLLKLGFNRMEDIQPDKTQPPLALFSLTK